MTLLDVVTCVCVCACREESWNDSTANTWKCCEMLQIIADWIRTVYMRMEWMGLETKTKTKRMVINFCCLVLAEIFLLVMCVDIGFAFLFYMDCKCCVEFLLSMLFCGISNIRRLRMPTKWVSTFILEYWNSIVEAEVGLVVPWRFLILEAYLRRMSQMYVRGLEHIGIYNTESFSCAILKLLVGNWLWILGVDFRHGLRILVSLLKLSK